MINFQLCHFRYPKYGVGAKEFSQADNVSAFNLNHFPGILDISEILKNKL